MFKVSMVSIIYMSVFVSVLDSIIECCQQYFHLLLMIINNLFSFDLSLSLSLSYIIHTFLVSI